MNEGIVITGIGMISHFGDKYEDFIKRLFDGNSALSEITLFNTDSYSCKIANGAKNFDAEKYLGKKGLRNMDRSTKLILTASQIAVNDSGYPLKDDFDQEIGVVAGNTFGSLKSISEYDRVTILESPSDVSPTDFANCVINSATGSVSIKFRAMCVNSTMSNGISSSLDAFGYSCDFINNGRAKMLITGGVEEFCEETFYGFYKSGLLALADNPDKLHGPFDKLSNGIILGEGSAMFTLEPVKSAQERGAKIYAAVAGYGRNFNDGTDPVRSMKRCMQKAIKDANIDISEIDAVITNTNGYICSDKSEIQALEEIFEQYTGSIPITSIKGAIGECYSASGAFQVATAIGMIERNEVPAIINCNDSIQVGPKLMIAKENIKKPINTVLVNSFGISGSNACVLIKRLKN